MIGALIGFLFFFSMCITVIYLIITPLVAIIWNRAYIIEYMFLLSPVIIISSYGLLFNRIIVSLNNYRKLGLGKILNGGFYIASVVVMVIISGGWTINAMVWATILYNLAYTLSLFFLLYTELKKQKIPLTLNFGKIFLLEIIELGKYFLVSNTLYDLLIKIDLLVLPLFASDEVVGYYSFAKNLIIRFRFLFNRLGGLLYPTFAELKETSGLENVKKLLIKSVYFSLFYVVLLIQIIFMFSQEMIWIVSTFLININEYLPSAPLLAILSFLLLAEGLRTILNSYFAGLAKIKVILKANLLGFIIGIISIIPLTTIFDAYGTAFAMLLAFFGLLFYYLFETHKREIAISGRKFLLRIVGSFLTDIITLFIYNFLIKLEFLPETINTVPAVIILTLIILFYIILDFSLMSLVNVITHNEILLIEKIAGKNRISITIIKIIKGYHHLFNRRWQKT